MISKPQLVPSQQSSPPPFLAARSRYRPGKDGEGDPVAAAAALPLPPPAALNLPKKGERAAQRLEITLRM